jgi:hypothetical protein
VSAYTSIFIPEGLVYMVDLTGFTSRLACCDQEGLLSYARALHDEFFLPIAMRTAAMHELAPGGASQWDTTVSCALVNTPGDAAILVFSAPAGELPFDHIVQQLCAMTRGLAVHVPDGSGKRFQLKFGMDVGAIVKCGKPLPGYPGVSMRSSDASFAPDFFIGDVINRLARIISSPAPNRHAPRISEHLWAKLSGQFRSGATRTKHRIRDYPEKGASDHVFYLLDDAQD